MGGGATLIGARTYRRGSHSSSDDPSIYGAPAGPRGWEHRDPIDRYRNYLLAENELSAALDNQWSEEIDDEIAEAVRYAEAVAPKPPLRTMFEDVYAHVPWHLEEQYQALAEHIRLHDEEADAAKKI